MLATRDRIRIIDSVVLANDWYLLKKTTFDFLRRDGTWQRQSRETYDRGNGAVILLYHRQKQTLLLTRQFRFPVFVNGHDGMLIEAAAGLLDHAEPEVRIRAEAEEETGYRVFNVRKVMESYMSPGSVTEKLYFFLGEYDDHSRIGAGGGVEDEGEDVETLEMTLPQALAAIDDGTIMDAKTIMLVQYVALHRSLPFDGTKR
ncbi:NUDIX domain-containing protein [Dickeya fangzhongdai]|uniref:GDP-mannose pyrophosphatase n=1 Tax=Dickeya fangzhongdai TaxID=1778540 RepID=A0A2K8QMU6_9GAMM|nr:NUDIX domain-containing protein [Dickeya fangzhongdai]ATZ94328.1 GDP-mannose pyrophosphatase [Dickeya fangzhongdai]QOH47765.1 GDP-mannose pyrophosphatase [Dickeya fangzhongdai]QOH52070.1 GDP-mannose pyrophosphatase [Dickeya fangzhongdai]WOY02287.1 NUDIX domain-containing protein [Dickeya fangzhongdai]WOY06789.1 NUDIX domain-containing protein [Dickeya fangzhongdai]